MRGSGVGLLDVSAKSENAGDQVITEAVIGELQQLRSHEWSRFSTHHRPSVKEIWSMKDCSYLLAGGSNMLNSHMEKNRQWLITPDLWAAMRGKVVLCGVGWWQHQEDPCRYSRRLLRSLLSSDAVHSVRDSYTASKVRRLGLKVVNTGCPTMWSLESAPMPVMNGRHVVTTLTDYNRNPARDTAMLRALQSSYEVVEFIAMAQEDLGYLGTLAAPGVVLGGVGLSALDVALAKDVDYFGTRLHAGVRALQNGRASAIMAIDNRAKEISMDTGLAVVEPTDVSSEVIVAAIAASARQRVVLDPQAIEAWRDAFSALVSEGRDGRN